MDPFGLNLVPDNFLFRPIGRKKLPAGPKFDYIFKKLVILDLYIQLGIWGTEFENTNHLLAILRDSPEEFESFVDFYSREYDKLKSNEMKAKTATK